MEHRSDDLIPSIRARLNASTANIPKLEGEVTVAQERLRRELNVVEKLRELLTLFEADTPTIPQSRVEDHVTATTEVLVEAQAVLDGQGPISRRPFTPKKVRMVQAIQSLLSLRGTVHRKEILHPSSERRADGSRTGPYGPFGSVPEWRARQVCV